MLQEKNKNNTCHEKPGKELNCMHRGALVWQVEAAEHEHKLQKDERCQTNK